MSDICPKVTKIGSIVGHRIDYTERQAAHTQQNLTQVSPAPTPPPRMKTLNTCFFTADAVVFFQTDFTALLLIRVGNLMVDHQCNLKLAKILRQNLIFCVPRGSITRKYLGSSLANLNVSILTNVALIRLKKRINQNPGA